VRVTVQNRTATIRVGTEAERITARLNFLPGFAGPPNSLAIGVVSTLDPGEDATASISGVPPNQTLTLGIPQGVTGASLPGAAHYETRAAAKAATIASTGSGGPLYVRTAGYSATGDGGNALYKRSDVPNVPGYGGFTSMDGQAWSLVAEGGCMNALQFGAIADGSSHALSTRYGSLGAAQADYPFATSTAQEIDYCAVKACSNYCFGADAVVGSYVAVPDGFYIDLSHLKVNGSTWTTNEHAGKTCYVKFDENDYTQFATVASNTADTLTFTGDMDGSFGGFSWSTHPIHYALGYGGEHGTNVTLNKEMVLPGGKYIFGNDTWLIRNLAGGAIRGAGRQATRIESNATCLAFDGLWYTRIVGITFATLTDTATAAVEIDGNISGHPYATRGVQGNTLQDVGIDASFSDYALTMCRQGGGGAQGSENLFLNVHLSSAEVACYFQNGFNALSNTFIGGNFQSYHTNGILVYDGTLSVFNTGFQSVAGYTQIQNDGYDIRMGDSGAYEGVVIAGCRSESLRFFYNGGAVTASLHGCVGRVGGMVNWTAGTAFGPGSPMLNGEAIVDTPGPGPTNSNNYRLYVATTPGTSGSTRPNFPSTNGATVADGTIVWTCVEFNWLYALGATSIDRTTVWNTHGDVVAPWWDHVIRYSDVGFTAGARGALESIICADATAGNITINLEDVGNRTFTVIRVDSGSHTITVTGSPRGFVETGSSSTTIPLGFGKSKTFVRGQYAGGAVAWFTIASNL
jgi:hypothetical protein